MSMENKKRETFFNLLSKAKSRADDIIGRYFDCGHFVEIPFKIVSIRRIKKDFLIMPSVRYESLMANMISGSEKVILYYQSLGMMGISHVKGLDKNKGLLLKFPSFIKLIDRRDHHRFSPIHNVAVTVRSQQVQEKRTCHDLSSGGFSMLLPNQGRAKLKRLKEAKAALNVHFRSSTGNIHLHCELIGVNKISPFENEEMFYGGQRLSFRFVQMTDKLNKCLENFMINNTDFKQQSSS